VRRRTRNKLLVETATTSLVFGGLAIAGLDIARRLFRHTQIFCPQRPPVRSWDPEDYGIPRDRVQQEWFESPDGELLYAWYCRTEQPIASAVFCHGNTGNLTTVAEVMPFLLAAGYNVLLFDYRGYGRSSGLPSFGGVVADGITAAQFHDTIRPKELPSMLYGFSLGGAVAAQVIQHHPFDGLILQSTFTSLPDIARAVFPRFPLHRLAGNLFDTRNVIRRLRVPLVVIHGTADEVCPSWMAHSMYDDCPSPKKLQMVDGGLHKDLFIRDPESIVGTLRQFVSGLPSTRPAIIDREQSSVDAIIDSAFRYARRYLRRRVAPEAL
jgi:alpha-beta hydrolase superfamily lysophospholipase